MKHLVIPISLLLLVNFSCKPRTEHTIVQGYVKTYGSETYHGGIEIELNAESVGSTLLDKTTTDSRGWFQLEGDFDRNKTHYLYLNTTPHLHQAANNWGHNFIQVERGGIQRVDVELLPYSWVKIHLKNIDPCNQNDFIVYYSHTRGTERVIGALTDTYIIWQTYGNQEVVFDYGVRKCETHGTFSDTVGYVAAFDTASFTVLY